MSKAIAYSPLLNASWIHGKYPAGEINNNLSYVSVESHDFFSQGSEADRFIDEILFIYNNSLEFTAEDAFNHWININF